MAQQVEGKAWQKRAIVLMPLAALQLTTLAGGGYFYYQLSEADKQSDERLQHLQAYTPISPSTPPQTAAPPSPPAALLHTQIQDKPAIAVPNKPEPVVLHIAMNEFGSGSWKYTGADFSLLGQEMLAASPASNEDLLGSLMTEQLTVDEKAKFPLPTQQVAEPAVDASVTQDAAASQSEDSASQASAKLTKVAQATQTDPQSEVEPVTKTQAVNKDTDSGQSVANSVVEQAPVQAKATASAQMEIEDEQAEVAAEADSHTAKAQAVKEVLSAAIATDDDLLAVQDMPQPLATALETRAIAVPSPEFSAPREATDITALANRGDLAVMTALLTEKQADNAADSLVEDITFISEEEWLALMAKQQQQQMVKAVKPQQQDSLLFDELADDVGSVTAKPVVSTPRQRSVQVTPQVRIIPARGVANHAMQTRLQRTQHIEPIPLPDYDVAQGKPLPVGTVVWLFIGELREQGWHGPRLLMKPGSGLPEVGESYLTQETHGLYDRPYGQRIMGGFQQGDTVKVLDVAYENNQAVWAKVSKAQAVGRF